MNDEQRKALVHLLQTVMEISYERGQQRSDYDLADEAKRLADVIEDDFLIDRLLTDRAVPEPDAVERAAETLCDFHAENEGGWWWCDQNNGWDHHAGVGRDYYRAMARAALAAVPTVQSAAGDDLDAIERAAKAMYFTDANPDPVKYDRVSAWKEEWEKHLAFYQSEGYDPEGFFPAFMLAKKALAAVPEPDADAVEAAGAGYADGATSGFRRSART